MKDELISRQVAIDAFYDPRSGGTYKEFDDGSGWYMTANEIYKVIKSLPSAQTEQTKMIKEIRKWINSENRGSADYFIVDKIEEIINKYE